LIIITGAAGFIGSNIAKRLNLMGRNDLLLLDNKKKYPSPNNLAKIKYQDYLHYDDIDHIKGENLECIFHQGACSDTMEYDRDFMMSVNYEYSLKMLDFAKSNQSKFIYASSASVYGTNQDSEEIERNENPLNLYAESKLLFDKYVMQQDYPAVGLRYFNVYGPGEEHKNKMASMPYKMAKEFSKEGNITLFKGTDGYKDGEQKRDFIYVEDVVSVNIFFMENLNHNIFNVGTGEAKSFNEIAKIIFKYEKKDNFKDYINYIDMPDSLKTKYQNFTEANIKKLRKSGYNYDFYNLQEGIFSYLNILATSSS
tara:strand:+ start:3985 stop:4917 length:933 start_codon:yes stop_codon:yes gene_type:complete